MILRRASLLLGMPLLAMLMGCGSSGQNETVDTGVAKVDSGSISADSRPISADTATSETREDAVSDAVVEVDVGDSTPPAEVGGICTFNRDCPAETRCECSEATGCFCLLGKRGVGKNGKTACTNGNDCETSLCVEGAAGSFVCSGECVKDSDCASLLPKCASVFGLGQICIRAGG